MSSSDNVETEQLRSNLQTIAGTVRELAISHEGDNLAILNILRVLESLHQEIRDGLFQESLPDNRQALYKLLRDIETSGGWPYIHRMKLQWLLSHFQTDPSHDQSLVFSESSSSPQDLNPDASNSLKTGEELG
jgi:hypothetical protein